MILNMIPVANRNMLIGHELGFNSQDDTSVVAATFSLVTVLTFYKILVIVYVYQDCRFIKNMILTALKNLMVITIQMMSVLPNYNNQL